MFRVMTANLNGIRSAEKKGFFDWLALEAIRPNALCVQEIRAQEHQMTDAMRFPAGLTGHFFPAEKAGYSGTGLYTQDPNAPITVGCGLAEFDAEGRWIAADLGHFILISAYFPSGSSTPERLESKFRFLEQIKPYIQQLIASGREVLVCGDVNIAHQEIDLKNWKGNFNNPGFLPQERAWLTDLFSEGGLVDIWRTLYPDVPGYTWWSNRGQARKNDVGWRIDYQMATPKLAAQAVQAGIAPLGERFSDHAALWVDFKFML